MDYTGYCDGIVSNTSTEIGFKMGIIAFIIMAIAFWPYYFAKKNSKAWQVVFSVLGSIIAAFIVPTIILIGLSFINPEAFNPTLSIRAWGYSVWSIIISPIASIVGAKSRVKSNKKLLNPDILSSS